MTRPQPKVAVAVGVGVSTLSLVTDCRGYNYAVFVGSTSSTTGVATTTVLEESDDNSTYTSVATGLTFATTSAATTVAKIVLNVDLRGRKRYLRPKFETAGGATTSINLTGLLMNGSQAQPTTATPANSLWVASI